MMLKNLQYIKITIGEAKGVVVGNIENKLTDDQLNNRVLLILQ